MNSKKALIIVELIILFIIVPGLLAVPLPIAVKLGSVILALMYVAFVSFKKKDSFTFKINFKKPTKKYLQRIAIISALIFFLGIGLIKFLNPNLLFGVLRNKPQLWVTILFVYAFLSVIPQELIYRSFFYDRYFSLFSNKNLFSILNVICFSWCHLFLNNIWVMLITVIGGIFFVYTYEKEKSIFWTIVEHSLYGNLIFTLGLGEMLAFPV